MINNYLNYLNVNNFISKNIIIFNRYWLNINIYLLNKPLPESLWGCKKEFHRYLLISWSNLSLLIHIIVAKVKSNQSYI